MPIDALNVLCAQLTSDLFAIAKFLLLLYFTPLHQNNVQYAYVTEIQSM